MSGRASVGQIWKFSWINKKNELKIEFYIVCSQTPTASRSRKHTELYVLSHIKTGATLHTSFEPPSGYSDDTFMQGLHGKWELES